MELSRHGPQQWIPAGLIGLSVTLLLGLLWISAPVMLETWELRTYDLRMQWRGAQPATDQLVLISRDEKSDARFGVGIWDRAVFAKMISALHRAGASVIALDFYFGEASPQERGGKLSDQALVDAAATAGTVLFPLRVSLEQDIEDMPVLPPRLKQRLMDWGPPTDPVVLRRIPQVGSISALLPGLINVAQGFGHIGASSDSDGVYRRVPVFVNGGGGSIPAMGVVLAAAHLKVKPEAIRLIPGATLELKGAIFPDRTQRDLSMPVDIGGNILIDYVGRWVDDPFPNRHFSFVDVWDSIDGKGNEEELRKHVMGKAVLILHAALESDKRRTPFELKAPGGFILANTFNTIVTEGRIHALPIWQQWGLVIVAATTAAWLIVLFPLWGGIVGVGGLTGMYVAGAYWGLAWFGVVFPMLLPVAGLVLATGGALAWMSWSSLGQLQVFKGKIQASESTRLALQLEVTSLQQLIEEQEAHVQRLEDESRHAHSARLALQQEIADLQELRQEKETQVFRLEREQVALQASSSAEQVQSLQVRATLEAELRRVMVEKAQVDRHSLQLQDQLDHEVEARANRERELRRVKEDLERTKETLAELSAKRTDILSSGTNRTALSVDERKRLQDLCKDDIVTSDPGVLHCVKDLEKVARSMVKIMFLGEPGTGKERFANVAHKLSERKRGPFVPVNMAAIPQDLFESQLFGHKKGAFSGAIADHDGYFIQADTGTLFLDEIGDLNLALQAKLLRVLQDGVVTRLGEKNAITVDVRVVSATNKDLSKEIAEGRFRQDLYDRLCGIEMRLPPLRERMGDVPALAELFINRAANANGKQPRRLSNGARTRLQAWTWPGNIRELEKCLERAVVLAEGTEITERDLGLGQASGEPAVMPPATVAPPMNVNTNDLVLEPNEARLLTALRQHSFLIGSAADKLDWSRDTVTEWLKGLCFKALVHHEFDMDNAAASLAGESGLTKLVLKKLNEYVDGLHTVVAKNPPPATDSHV